MSIFDNKPRYKHLFFDLDHTLWDFDKNSEVTWRGLYETYKLAELGIPEFEEFFRVYTIHNDRLWERFRNKFIKREELRWKRIWLTLLDFRVPNSALAYEMSAAYLEILPTQTLLMPYTKEILDYCKDKYELHLITNGFEMTQRQKLHYAGIGDYFKEVVTSEKSNSMKPHGEIFSYALQCTGAECAQSLMIGDAIDIDILGAINAGWDSVYYNPNHLAHNRKPTYEIKHLQELTSIL